jgi:hypothetical protein
MHAPNMPEVERRVSNVIALLSPNAGLLLSRQLGSTFHNI